MKKIQYILIAAICALTLSSCEKFLDVNPRTKVSEAEYFSNEEEMMRGFYNILWEVKHRLLEIHDYSSYLSDESETGGGLGEGSYKYKWDNFTYSPSNCFGEYGYGSWWNEWDYGIYNAVVAANILADKLEACTLPESFVKPLLAETKFFRALVYNYLWMSYEEIPLIKGILKAEDMYTVEKGSRQAVFDYMMEDLSDENIAALPPRSAVEQGRICADAAKVLRAKIILFHRSEKDYEKALNDMKGIITSKTYSLDPDFKHLWLKDGEWGPENIYNISASTVNDEGMGFVHGLGGRNLSDPRSAEQGGLLNGYGQCTVSSYIYNMFEEGDTRREGSVIVYADEMEKVAKLVAEGELPEGSEFTVSEEQENYEGFGHFKYTPRKENTGSVKPENNHGNPFRFYRYADVLLLGTELAVRTNKLDSQSQDWFDQIRDRAFGDTKHRISLTGMSQKAALDVLFKERFYEFYDEMQRWFDILRFDKGTEILGSKGWTEKFRYFPIDQTEIDRSQGGLTQNPGWS